MARFCKDKVKERVKSHPVQIIIFYIFILTMNATKKAVLSRSNSQVLEDKSESGYKST